VVAAPPPPHARVARAIAEQFSSSQRAAGLMTR
jgi:hypothetical protein